jgi:hypothetical protein
MGNMSGACRSFVQYRMSFWRGNSWASSTSINTEPSRGGDGNAFLALFTKSVWFKDELSMSQSVSRLDAMVFCGHLGKPIVTDKDDQSIRAGAELTHGSLCSLTINYEEQKQTNKISSCTSS